MVVAAMAVALAAKTRVTRVATIMAKAQTGTRTQALAGVRDSKASAALNHGAALTKVV